MYNYCTGPSLKDPKGGATNIHSSDPDPAFSLKMDPYRYGTQVGYIKNGKICK
jgi:hypothetical protein